MDINKLTKDELIDLVNKKEEKNAALVEHIASLEERLAEKESELSAPEASFDISEEQKKKEEELKQIRANEALRASKTEKVTLQLDPNPDSVNTYSCSLNGVVYLIPRGEEVEVPVAVAEIIREQQKSQRNAVNALGKASGVKEIAAY